MKKLKLTMTFAFVALLAVSLISCDEKYPELGDGLFAEIVTNKGTMVAKLHYDQVPVTVANFVALAEGNHPMVTDTLKGKPFYNGLIFHRVMDDFMIQGGDIMGSGSGSPGYKFGDELDINLKHDKPGVLAMANPGANANGSQFYITEKETPWLDGYDENGNLKDCQNPRIYCHSVFGQVVLGMDVRDTISNVQVGPGNRPIKDIIIQELNIVRQGFDARKFDAVKTWETELPLLEERAKKKEEEARKKAEEAQKAALEKIEAAAGELLPTLEDYKGKAKKLASGLLIHTITEGNGEKPKQGQNVKVWYEGYFTDGKLLDTNRKDVAEKYGQYNRQRELQKGYETTTMLVSPDANLVAGFKEGLANMKVGDKKYVYLPSHLAWGERGSPPVIQPNTDVVFIIEMVEIMK